MSTNLVSTNNLAVNNNLTVNGNILGSGAIQTTANIQGANITATSNLNVNNINLTGQLNNVTLTNLNSLDTTSSITSQFNTLTSNVSSLQTKANPLTYNSPNLGIFNTSPSYPLDVTASTFRIGPLVQENNNGTICLTNTSCSSDPANFCLYQGINGDTVLNCGLNETIEFKVHNSQVCMLNSTGIGVGNGNPQYPIDVTGSINATNVLINGTSVSSLPFSIKACGYWNGSSTTNANYVVSALYGTHWLTGNLTGIQFILNPITNLQGLIFVTVDTDGYVCQAHRDNTNQPFTFVVQMLSAGSAPTVTGQQNVQFFWMVI
jgi:hypothetical protein